MTYFENHEPETEMWIYITNLPADYTESDLQAIFDKIGNYELVIKEVRFVPCFHNPYNTKCAYILFYSWFTCSRQVSDIEAHFLNRTFYTYETKSRTWVGFLNRESPVIRSHRIYYSKKGLSRKTCAKKWDLIKTHFLKTKNNQNIIGELLSKINRLEERIVRLEDACNMNVSDKEEGYVDL